MPRARGRATIESATAVVDACCISPDPRLAAALVGGVMVVCVGGALAQVVASARGNANLRRPNAIFFRMPSDLEPRDVYDLYFIYAVSPVMCMAYFVLWHVGRAGSKVKRAFITFWAAKTTAVVATTLLGVLRLLPSFTTRSGETVSLGTMLSTLSTDLFYLPLQGAAAPWSSRRLAVALAVEGAYKALGYASSFLVHPTLSLVAFLLSVVLGTVLIGIVVVPTRPRGANADTLPCVVGSTRQRQSVLSRDQAMVTGCFMSGIRLLLVLHFSVTSIFPRAASLDTNRVVMIGAMFEELVIPAAIVHLCFTRIDSLTVQYMAAERDKQSRSRIEAQHRVVRWVCHEVRVPLSSVQLGIGDIRATLEDALVSPGGADAFIEQGRDIEGSISIIERAMERMQAVLDDMLTYEKLQHGKLRFAPSRFDLRLSVRDVVHQFSRLAADKGVEVVQRWARPDGGVYRRCSGDSTRLVQVLSNFTSNALNAVAPGGRVAIECAAFSTPPPGSAARWTRDCRPRGRDECDGGGWAAQPSAIALAADSIGVLWAGPGGRPGPERDPGAESPRSAPSRALLCARVVDTGVGITVAQQRQLFCPFSHLRSGELGGGTGLGLAICLSIAHMHDGHVGVCSAGPGRGSEFWIEWAVDLGGSGADGADGAGDGGDGGEGGQSPEPTDGIETAPASLDSRSGFALECADEAEIESSASASLSSASCGRLRSGAAIKHEARMVRERAPRAADATWRSSASLPAAAAAAAAAAAPSFPSLPRLPGLAAVGPTAAVRRRAAGGAELPALPPVPRLAPAEGAAPGTAPHSDSRLPRAPAPIATAPAVAPPALPSPPRGSAAAGGQLAGLRVFVVDDQQGNRVLLSKHLQRRGAEVRAADDGLSLVRRLQRDGRARRGDGGPPPPSPLPPPPPPPDVILLDKEMPSMSGYDVLDVALAARGEAGPEAAARARALEARFGLDLAALRAGLGGATIVGVTGNALRVDVLEFQARGAARVVCKPVDMARLLDAIRDALARNRAPGLLTGGAGAAAQAEAATRAPG